MKFKKIKILICALIILAKFCSNMYALNSKLEKDASKVYDTLKIEAVEYKEHNGEHWFDGYTVSY